MNAGCLGLTYLLLQRRDIFPFFLQQKVVNTQCGYDVRAQVRSPMLADSTAPGLWWRHTLDCENKG